MIHQFGEVYADSDFVPTLPVSQWQVCSILTLCREEGTKSALKTNMNAKLLIEIEFDRRIGYQLCQWRYFRLRETEKDKAMSGVKIFRVHESKGSWKVEDRKVDIKRRMQERRRNWYLK